MTELKEEGMNKILVLRTDLFPAALTCALLQIEQKHIFLVNAFLYNLTYRNISAYVKHLSLRFLWVHFKQVLYFRKSFFFPLFLFFGH